MSKVWQLPVVQSNRTDHDWIHPKAKYHYFVNNHSLCGKIWQDTSCFETSPKDNGHELTEELACKKCYKLYKEMENE